MSHPVIPCESSFGVTMTCKNHTFFAWHGLLPIYICACITKTYHYSNNVLYIVRMVSLSIHQTYFMKTFLNQLQGNAPSSYFHIILNMMDTLLNRYGFSLYFLQKNYYDNEIKTQTALMLVLWHFFFSFFFINYYE